MINPSQVVPDKPEVQDTAAEPVTTTRPTCNPPAYPWLRDGLSFVSVCQSKTLLTIRCGLQHTSWLSWLTLFWKLLVCCLTFLHSTFQKLEAANPQSSTGLACSLPTAMQRAWHIDALPLSKHAVCWRPPQSKHNPHNSFTSIRNHTLVMPDNTHLSLSEGQGLYTQH